MPRVRRKFLESHDCSYLNKRPGRPVQSSERAPRTRSKVRSRSCRRGLHGCIFYTIARSWTMIGIAHSLEPHTKRIDCKVGDIVLFVQHHILSTPSPPSTSLIHVPLSLFSSETQKYQKHTMASLRSVPQASAAPIHAPAPWTLKGDMYWLFLRLSSPLPQNVYHPLDIGQHSSPTSSSFQGGFGTIQIIRYSESPVGPYDELMLIPGEYEVPGGEHKGKSKVRVSRIYVNQKETCYNGISPQTSPFHCIASS